MIRLTIFKKNFSKQKTLQRIFYPPAPIGTPPKKSCQKICINYEFYTLHNKIYEKCRFSWFWVPFVRLLSGGALCGSVWRFMLLVCICSAFGRFVALWGFCAFVSWVWAVFLRPFVVPALCPFSCVTLSGSAAGSDALRGSCGPSFVGSFPGLPALVGCFAAFGRGYSVKFCPVAVSGFGYSLPVVFSGSFSDPVRLLLFS